MFDYQGIIKEIQTDTNKLYCVLPIYRYFPTRELAVKQYEMASEHAKAYIRGEF